jgi:predicted alpha/beta-hydrolase family hydrolase
VTEEPEATGQFEEIEIPLVEPVHGLESVTGVLGVPEWWPTGSRISVVMAQASAAEDPLLDSIQRRLTERKILTLRFPMPFMAAGKRRPDDLRVMTLTYQAAVGTLSLDPTAAPAHVFAGGKNLGAQVATQAASSRMRLEGLFFLGFPLHKQDDPSEVRAERLYRLINPLLFIQGEHDRNCDLPTLRQTLARVGAPVQLHVVAGADHGLRVSKKSGRSPEQAQDEIVTTLERWMRSTLGESEVY